MTLGQTQMYNHIPGNGVITRKDLLVETVKYLNNFKKSYKQKNSSYLQKYNDKPQCIQKATFAPQAYRLNGMKPTQSMNNF